MADDKTYSAVKVRWSPDALLKVCCFVILGEMLISPAKINYISEKCKHVDKDFFFYPKLPEVYVVISAISELALIAATASASEEHLQPMLLQVVIEVSPPEILSIMQRLICRTVLNILTSISIV